MPNENQTPSAQVDIIDYLVEQLTEGTGIQFAADAWENAAPANYGVVELTGEAGNDYADGKRVAKGYAVDITLYVTGGSHIWIEKVESVLDGMKIPHTMPARLYLFDIKKVSWTWQTRIRKSILKAVADAEDPEGGSDTGDPATGTGTDTGGGASGAGDDGGGTSAAEPEP